MSIQLYKSRLRILIETLFYRVVGRSPGKEIGSVPTHVTMKLSLSMNDEIRGNKIVPHMCKFAH